jgi:hypothetical protein
MQTPITHKKKTALIPLAIALILMVSYFSYAYFSKSLWPFLPKEVTQSYEEKDSTPGTVRTQEDAADSQDAKKKIIEQEDNPTQGKDSLDVTITSTYFTSGAIEVRAFTDTVIESGECTLTATKGDISKTVVGRAFIDASSTICAPLTVDTGDTTAGEWSVTVKIQTASSEGTSAALKASS